MAIEAVEDKLKWCAERLKSCENVEEVIKLYETIDRGIGILKLSRSTWCALFFPIWELGYNDDDAIMNPDWW